MVNISELTWIYVKQRPFLKEVLKEGIVNYSSLARKIALDAFGNLDNENAIKMALVRLSKKMEKTDNDLEAKILDIMRKSSMTIKNKITVVISTKFIENIKPLSYAISGRYTTYILEQNEADRLSNHRSITKTETNLNLITVESPKELEEVPGVISYILGALASEGINVVEFISCYTNTLLVINQADTERAYKVLSNIMR